MTYESEIDTITSAIITTLKEVTEFNQQAYKGFWHLFGEEDYPNCMVSLERDELREMTSGQDVHNLFYLLMVQIKGTGDPEADFDSFVNIIGKVIDIFQADVTIDSSCSWCKPVSVDYTFQRGESLVFYVAGITLKVVKSW